VFEEQGNKLVRRNTATDEVPALSNIHVSSESLNYCNLPLHLDLFTIHFCPGEQAIIREDDNGGGKSSGYAMRVGDWKAVVAACANNSTNRPSDADTMVRSENVFGASFS
jgi:hypothetical protein